MPCSWTAARPLAISPTDLSRLVVGQPADPAQQRLQILAVDVFHREEVVAVGLAGVEDPADVGMGDLASDLHLFHQACQPLLVFLQPSRQHLERHRLTELEIVGAVDLAHTALAEKAHDTVAPCQDLTWEEPALLELRWPRRDIPDPLAPGASKLPSRRLPDGLASAPGRLLRRHQPPSEASRTMGRHPSLSVSTLPQERHFISLGSSKPEPEARGSPGWRRVPWRSDPKLNSSPLIVAQNLPRAHRSTLSRSSQVPRRGIAQIQIWIHLEMIK